MVDFNDDTRYIKTCQWMGGCCSEIESCEHPVIEGKSYCKTHYSKVFYPYDGNKQHEDDLVLPYSPLK